MQEHVRPEQYVNYVSANPVGNRWVPRSIEPESSVDRIRVVQLAKEYNEQSVHVAISTTPAESHAGVKLSRELHASAMCLPYVQAYREKAISWGEKAALRARIEQLKSWGATENQCERYEAGYLPRRELSELVKRQFSYANLANDCILPTPHYMYGLYISLKCECSEADACSPHDYDDAVTSDTTGGLTEAEWDNLKAVRHVVEKAGLGHVVRLLDEHVTCERCGSVGVAKIADVSAEFDGVTYSVGVVL